MESKKQGGPGLDRLDQQEFGRLLRERLRPDTPIELPPALGRLLDALRQGGGPSAGQVQRT